MRPPVGVLVSVVGLALFAPARAARADDALPAEVVVRGDAAGPGGTTLRAGEVRQIPGTFGDPLRALEIQPGVVPLGNGLPYFFVRGAPPSATGYFIDGIRVPLLYHVGFGPSVLPAPLLEHVDYYAGGYPASYGRLVGGVVAGTTRDPSDHLHGEASIRVFDVAAIAEAPLGSNATALAGARYSYTGGILSLTGSDTQFSYWDYQARASWNPTPNDRITVFAFGSFDDLSDTGGLTGSDPTNLSTEFHRVDVRYDHALGTHGTFRIAATLGSDRTRNGSDAQISDRMAAARIALDDRLTSWARLRAGADVVVDRYELEPSASIDPVNLAALSLLYPSRTDSVVGAHADVVLRAGSRVELTPGARLDLYRTGDATPRAAADPRLAARVAVMRDVHLVSTFGWMHQPAAFFVPLPGLDVTSAHNGLQSSVQTSQGIEVALPEAVTLATTVFLHDYLDMADISTTCPVLTLTNPVGRCVDARVRGRAIGLEVLLRRSFTKRVSGWLSYTLSRSTREMPEFQNPSRIDTVASAYDRTHVLNAAAAYSLGRGWRVGARVYAYSGRPYSDQVNIPVPPYNIHRFPGFVRLDARVEKRWKLGETSSIAAIAEWMNATLARDPSQLACVRTDTIHDPPQTLDTCTVRRTTPVTVPSVGVEVGF
jgi:TonB-dependent Receptor Plug Domain